MTDRALDKSFAKISITNPSSNTSGKLVLFSAGGSSIGCEVSSDSPADDVAPSITSAISYGGGVTAGLIPRHALYPNHASARTSANVTSSKIFFISAFRNFVPFVFRTSRSYLPPNLKQIPHPPPKPDAKYTNNRQTDKWVCFLNPDHRIP